MIPIEFGYVLRLATVSTGQLARMELASRADARGHALGNREMAVEVVALEET